MSKWLGRGLTAAGFVVALAGGVVVAGDELADIRRHRTVELAPYPLVVVDDAASVARGKSLYASRGCADCHGADATGRKFVDDGKGFVLAGPAIGTGPGSVTVKYTPADWERTIRHGVKPDGRPALIMPSENYNGLTDDDVAALVAYLGALPPKRGSPAVLDLPLRVRMAYGFGALDDAATKIDHRRSPWRAAQEGPVAGAAGERGG
jgi:mono/diheme cytochrome c family protein